MLIICDGPLDDGAEDTYIPRLNSLSTRTDNSYGRGLTSVAQTSLNGNARGYITGRVVGGGTLINGMLFIRGTYPDYDAWETLGNPGWAYRDVLPSFIKSETFTPQQDPAIAAKYGMGYNKSVHGTSGPVENGFGRYYWSQSANVFQGAALAGVPTVLDANDGSTAGAKFTPSNIDHVNMTRCTARTAYWNPNSKKKNFHLLTNNTVTRVIFGSTDNVTKSDGNLTATAVEFAADVNATRLLVNVTQEVILTAGVLFTPQLLQVSGVGPSALLESLGIKVQIDLPGVGENYQDHPMVDLSYIYQNVTDSPALEAASTTREAESRREYFGSRTGPWTAWPSTANLYPSLPSISNRSKAILAQASKQNAADLLPAGTDQTVIAGYQEEIALNAKLLASKDVHHHQIINDNNGGWTISLMRSFSRGYVRATTNSIFDDPEWNPRYCSNPIDYDLFVEGILWNRKLLDTAPMKELQPLETKPTRNASEYEIRKLVSNGVRTEWHGCGTAAMRPLSKGGVVSPRLKVYMTTNLRVADTSINPMIIGANSQASMYAFAEKAADIIKEDAAARKNKHHPGMRRGPPRAADFGH